MKRTMLKSDCHNIHGRYDCVCRIYAIVLRSIDKGNSIYAHDGDDNNEEEMIMIIMIKCKDKDNKNDNDRDSNNNNVEDIDNGWLCLLGSWEQPVSES